jgi:hypothetical protein
MSIKLALQTAMMMRLSCDRLIYGKTLPGPEQFASGHANTRALRNGLLSRRTSLAISALSAVCVSPLAA